VHVTKVIVVGGGIGGMTAAQELLERGFEVSVYDYRSIPGGKSRTIPAPNSGTNGRPDLPGEHGFRFVPAFYRHLPDSMTRIPFPGNKNGVYDNLVGTTRIEIAPYDKAPIEVLSRFPRNFDDVLVVLKDLFDPPQIGLLPGEIEFFAKKMWQVMTSCRERRLHELENQSWLDYTDAKNKSPAYQTYLANGLSRSLVAAQPELASARTIGQVQVHLLFGMMNLFVSSTDRVLDGPTSPRLIEPWIAHIRAMGGKYTSRIECTDFACQQGRITSVGLKNRDTGEVVRETADYYVSALPVEVMGPLVNADMTAPGAAPFLATIRDLQKSTRWMNGIQFFLKKDITVVHGHTLYVNSPWALTSISEAQFWSSLKLSDYGDGQVNGVLSVDISEWCKPGTFNNKFAENCTPQEIADEVWAELTQSLNVPGQPPVISQDDIHSWFLDTDIADAPRNSPNVASNNQYGAAPGASIDKEPLFINEAGSWEKRPQADTAIENFLLAADYVQTNADLACMDSANEAARRAVNAILDRTGSSAVRCEIWDMDMPDIFAPLRALDSARYEQGLPWTDFPLPTRPPPAASLRNVFNKPPVEVPANAPAIDAKNLTLADDGYHLYKYQTDPNLFWFTEWWYFNFIDKKTGKSGMVTFAVFNGADIDLMGVASLNAAVFDPKGTGITMEIDFHTLNNFWALNGKADVDLAGSRLRVLPDGSYQINASTADGSVAMGLTYQPMDEPQLLADGVHASSSWEVSSWLAWMPSAKVNGWVSVHGNRIDLVDATGYHDHDWGIWYVPGNVWAWASFSDLEQKLGFDVGLHAAFQKSTAYFRFGDLRLFFPQDNFKYAFADWEPWKILWKYPQTVTFSAIDATGQYQVSMTWKVLDTATLYKYPLIVFEQSAHFAGTLHQKDGAGWKTIASFDTQGFCEYTSKWIGGGPE
jgi:15-cis-phytoene desaturase